MIKALACRQSEFAAALLDPRAPCPGGIVAWNGSDPAVRLAVHRNNVVSSLVDALAETFPVVQELVGDVFFRAMAAVFVRRWPPRTRVLAHYGEDFAAFIEGFEPARSVPYLADMARLEMARVRAYHAADAEPVSAEIVAMAMACGDRVGELRLACHPSVSVLASAHAVVSLWAAHQGVGELGAVDPDAGESALVVRKNLEVLVLKLSPGAVEFVRATQQELGLGSAVAVATSAAPGFDLSSMLGLLMGQGALTSIHLPRRYNP